MTVKIFIGNLSEDSDQDDIHKMFLEHGTVVECHVVGRFGFVHMDSEDEAQAAISAIHGTMYKGRRINVELSTGVNRRNEPGWKEGSGSGGRGGGRGRGRGRGDFGGRGSRGDRPYPSRRPDPYSRDPYDPYSRRPLDPYDDPRPLPPRDLYRDPYRDPYSRLDRDPYARDPYARDPYARDPYSRDPYARDPYARLDRDPLRDPLRDPYTRPPPEYYRDPYSRGTSPDRDRYYDLYYERRTKGDLPPPRSYLSDRPYSDRSFLSDDRGLSSLDRSAGDRPAPDRDTPFGGERRFSEKPFSSGPGDRSFSDTTERTPWSRPQNNGQSGLNTMGVGKPRPLMAPNGRPQMNNTSGFNGSFNM